ncbi:MAG: hypothetical protein RSB55_09015, partial [Oscillospiraceae bacterium]
YVVGTYVGTSINGYQHVQHIYLGFMPTAVLVEVSIGWRKDSYSGGLALRGKDLGENNGFYIHITPDGFDAHSLCNAGTSSGAEYYYIAFR